MRFWTLGGMERRHLGAREWRVRCLRALPQRPSATFSAFAAATFAATASGRRFLLQADAFPPASAAQSGGFCSHDRLGSAEPS